MVQKYLPNPLPPKPARLDPLERACRERVQLMIQVAESIALNPLSEDTARLKAVQLVCEFGYGKPAVRITQEVTHVSQSDGIVIEHIAEAQQAAEMTARIAEYCKMQIPFANWPEDVQLASNFLQGIEP